MAVEDGAEMDADQAVDFALNALLGGTATDGSAT